MDSYTKLRRDAMDGVRVATQDRGRPLVVLPLFVTRILDNNQIPRDIRRGAQAEVGNNNIRA